MQAIPRWRNVLILRTSIIHQVSSSSSSPSTHLASFHATPISSEKWKSKWNSDFRRAQQPSKNYIRYATRQKRADAKRALKDILFTGGSSKITFQRYFPEMDEASNPNGEQEDHSDSSDTKSRSKSSARRASKARYKRMKRKVRQESFSDEFDEHPERIFQAKFGNRWFTWSFKSWKESSFQNSTNEFEWRDHSEWTNGKTRQWQNASDIESDDETCVIGSSSDRRILGLPPKGSLKIEDVKKAFRLSALKWHPDKHQGFSQAMAEEKFKHCVDAYKSLCNALT